TRAGLQRVRKVSCEHRPGVPNVNVPWVALSAALGLVACDRRVTTVAAPPASPQAATATATATSTATPTPTATSPPSKVACGPLDCPQYDSPRDAFADAIASDPMIIGIGESHAPKGAAVASSAKRFTQELLPLLAGRASNLLVELMAPPSGCTRATDEVRDK